MGQQHLLGDEACLIGEHRASGEKKYLADLPTKSDLRTLAPRSKPDGWAYQQLKEERGPITSRDGPGKASIIMLLWP